MAYTHFRFIAYEVPTVTGIPGPELTAPLKTKTGFGAGLECDEVDTIPVDLDRNLPDDARIRLKRLASVVDLAARNIEVGSGDVDAGDVVSGDEGSGHEDAGDVVSGDEGSGHEDAGDVVSGDGGSGHEDAGDVVSGDEGSGDDGSGDDDSSDQGSGDEDADDENELVLNIFMAPEFYFRPPSTAGSNYESNTYPMDHALQIIGQINTMFMDPRFKNWLFVLGTIAWNWELPFGGPRLYGNSAVYVRGNKTDGLGIIEKCTPADNDGFPNPYQTQIVARRQMQAFYQEWALRKQRVFDIDGIGCGLEVCLDHQLQEGVAGVLKHVLSLWQEKEGTEATMPQLKLHLLTAAGMNIQEISVAAVTRGYILRNDGLAKSSGGPRSEIQQISRYTNNDTGKPTGPADVHGKAIFWRDAFGYKEELLKGAHLVPSASEQFGKEWPEFPQRLVIYDPCALVAEGYF